MFEHAKRHLGDEQTPCARCQQRDSPASTPDHVDNSSSVADPTLVTTPVTPKSSAPTPLSPESAQTPAANGTSPHRPLEGHEDDHAAPPAKLAAGIPSNDTIPLEQPAIKAPTQPETAPTRTANASRRSAVVTPTRPDEPIQQPAAPDKRQTQSESALEPLFVHVFHTRSSDS